MADNNHKITKSDIRKEIKKESKAYRRKRRWSTLAVILVLIAVVLLFIFADEKGLLGPGGTSLGLGGKATDVVNRAASAIESINSKIDSKRNNDNNKVAKENEEVIKSNGVENKLHPEETEEKLIDNFTIVVKGSDIIYKGETYEKVEMLKEKLLEQEFTSNDVLTLKDDKAIRATYEDVKNLLEDMEEIQFIEE